MLRTIIATQVWLSRHFDRLLPEKYRIDGNRDYINDFAPKHLAQGQTIIDIGGGKQPYLSLERKRSLNAKVIGLDIDGAELARAPAGAYDETIVADVSKFRGDNQADLLVCQAVLEHVQDVPGAFIAISSALKPGGKALIFVPSRNAVFARLNIVLPQQVKEWLLYTIFPKTRAAQGFPSFYNRCTPNDFKQLAAENGLTIIDSRYYYISSYFSFCFPLYMVWRFWILLFAMIYGAQAAETFSMVLQKAR